MDDLIFCVLWLLWGCFGGLNLVLFDRLNKGYKKKHFPNDKADYRQLKYWEGFFCAMLFPFWIWGVIVISKGFYKTWKTKPKVKPIKVKAGEFDFTHEQPEIHSWKG